MKKLIQFINQWCPKSIFIWRTSYVTEEEYQAERKKGKELAKKSLKFQLKLWMWGLIVGGGLAVMMFLSEDFREWMNTVLN